MAAKNGAQFLLILGLVISGKSHSATVMGNNYKCLYFFFSNTSSFARGGNGFRKSNQVDVQNAAMFHKWVINQVLRKVIQ